MLPFEDQPKRANEVTALIITPAWPLLPVNDRSVAVIFTGGRTAGTAIDAKAPGPLPASSQGATGASTLNVEAPMANGAISKPLLIHGDGNTKELIYASTFVYPLLP
jgi:hypothetical protein